MLSTFILLIITDLHSVTIYLRDFAKIIKMRRKQKNGVYTNRTIKFCPSCIHYCHSCKGPCKIEYGVPYYDETVAENHPLISFLKRNFVGKNGLHKVGFGDIKAGSRFIPFSSKGHIFSKPPQKESISKQTNFIRYLKYDIPEQIRIYEISVTHNVYSST